jgi:Spy/CpxP family protein refolding chaperone
MRQRVRRLGVFVAAGLAAGSVWAQPLAVPPGRWWDRPRVAEALALTAEQRQSLDSTTLEHLRGMIDLKAKVEKSELDLRAVADAEPFDAKRARSAFATLQQARMNLEMARFEMLLKVREILSPQQWQQLKTFARARRAGRGGERGERSPGEGEAPGPPGGPRRY